MSGGVVAAVARGSLADALGIRVGDVLVEINGHPLRDVLDVQFYASEEDLDLLVHRGDKEMLFQGERVYGVPLGLDFASPTFDGLQQCRNRCDFCFVTQMPPGLRPSLYVRDDDYRYSVLYGNFITLTRLTARDWDRLAEQRLSPLYVSIQATEPALRRRLLGRDDLPDILLQLDRLAELRIEVHAQIVLIPGINDGFHLDRTLNDLAERYPTVQSIGIVPVGLTRYHRGQCRPYTSQEAAAVIAQVEPFQLAFRARHGLALAYLADEWYLLAGRAVPADEAYDGYPQIENGIGLVRQFLEDSRELRVTERAERAESCTLVCGTLIAPAMRCTAQDLASRLRVRIEVLPVANRLFGEKVTVSGLLCGEDVVTALHGRELGDVVLLPRAMFAEVSLDAVVGALEVIPGCRSADEACRPREGALRTLDDLTLGELTERIGRPVVLGDLMSEVWAELAGSRPSPARIARAGEQGIDRPVE